MWDRSGRPLSTFVTSPTTSRLVSLSAMTSRDYRAPTMIWNIALASHGSMSGEPRADVGPFLAWSSVVPSVSSPLWSPERRDHLALSSFARAQDDTPASDSFDSQHVVFEMD